MEWKNRIRNYLLEEEFYLNVYLDKVNVLHYERIGHFDSSKVIIENKNHIVIVKGKDLIVSKLMKEELLIVGKIESVELR